MSLIPGGPPAAPATITLSVGDAIVAFVFLAAVAFAAGLVIGSGHAVSVAEHAEAVASQADATLAEARRLCGGGR